MAKTRLNSSDRELLTEDIVGHKYNPLQLKREQEEFALADETYNCLYSPAVLKKMKELPDNAFGIDSDIMVAVSGKRFELNFSPGRFGHPHAWAAAGKPIAQDYRPFFYSHINSISFSVLDGDDLGDRIVANKVLCKDLEEERNTMLARVRATLDSFRYFDDLLAAFPEAESFIMKRWRERPEGGSPGVPAVVIKDLARALDLPPGA